MLFEEVQRYRELSLDYNQDTPISRIGGYLDGYDKAIDDLKFFKNELDPVSEGVLIRAVGIVIDYLEKVKE